MVTNANPLSTPAMLAADCAALIAELRSVRARLLAMDMSNGSFRVDGARVASSKSKARVGGAAFVTELATRLDNIELRLKETQRKVRGFVQNKVVATGFPSGQSKVPNP